MFPIRSFLRRVRELFRAGAPPALTVRVYLWLWGYAARELAFQFSFLLTAAIAVLVLTGLTDATFWGLVCGALAVLLGYELRFAWQAWRSAAAIADELAEEIPGGPAKTRFPRSHLLFPILMWFPRNVVRKRDVVYHREEGQRVRLDVYMPKQHPEDGQLRPAVIEVHGGGWIFGSKAEQGIPLLNHLAANGWVGFNIDYRLSPRATMPEHVIDVKRAIAWVREHAAEYQVDPERICLTGGSAGGHLCALAALTSDDKSLQPGFEDADTSVVAAVPFYGLYDLLDAEERYYHHIRDWLIAQIVIKRDREADPDAFRAVSPTHRIHPGAPPFMIFHGEDDSLVPTEDARTFARRLEEISREKVLYIELPGSEHAFDLAPSLRCARVVEGIERFLRTVVDPAPDSEPEAREETERELVA